MATGTVTDRVVGAVIRVVRVVVAGAARGDVKTVVTVVGMLSVTSDVKGNVKGDVRVDGSVVVRLAGSAAVIGVATGDNGDS